MHICIAGNIGAGKTTLTHLLSKHFKWKAHYESVEKNPYIGDFYNDMKKWSFHLQMYFLGSRFRQIKALEKEKNIIQDRTIYEDAYIFAANLNKMGLLDLRDYQTYLDFFEFTIASIKAPDLLIYLRASVPTLIKQINKRAREYENDIDEAYLDKLNEYYEKWISTYKENLLIFDMDQINFVEKKENLGLMIKEIKNKIQSLPKSN